MVAAAPSAEPGHPGAAKKARCCPYGADGHTLAQSRNLRKDGMAMQLQKKPRGSIRSRISNEYRAYLRYELGIRRQVILLRVGVVVAILLGLVNFVLNLQARIG
jgi:hypothetical protein